MSDEQTTDQPTEAFTNPGEQPPPATLMEVLQGKLAAARSKASNAEAEVKQMEEEIAALPAHLHDLTFSGMISKVKSWFE